MLKDEFKYGEISSAKFDIYCEQETHSILPELRQYTQEIPGVDGVVDYGIGGYNVRIITLPLVYKGSFKKLRENREKIIAWLAGDGTPKKLMLGREPGRYYLAKIFSEINFTNNSNRYIGSIEFTCNPPWQYLTDGTKLTPEQIEYVNCNTESGKFIKEFTENGSIRFYNNGTANVKPVIKLIGNLDYSFISLSYGDFALKCNKKLGYDGIVIDCENETIKRMSDGTNLYEYLSDLESDFFSLSPGQCEIHMEIPSATEEYPEPITIVIEFNAMTRG